MKFQSFIGIDAGRGGGIAIIADDKMSIGVKMPHDFESLLEYLKYLKSTNEKPLVVIEQIRTHFGDHRKNNHVLIENYNEIKSICKFLKLPFIEVMPRTWQKYLKLNLPFENGIDYETLKLLESYKPTNDVKREIGRIKSSEYAARKRRFKRYAERIFKGSKITMKTADAFLLAEFGRRKYNNDRSFIMERLPEQLQKTI